MKQFRLLVLPLLTVFFAQAAYSQCCCSGAEVTITDGGGVPLPAADVKVKEFGKESGYRIQFDKDKKNDVSFRFRVGCGNGKEALLIEYMGIEMRVRFKLYGEFGSPKANIVFSTGDHVAEFEKERDDEGRQTVVLRGATAEEMKEIEPPPPADDAPQDQTAQAF